MTDSSATQRRTLPPGRSGRASRIALATSGAVVLTVIVAIAAFAIHRVGTLDATRIDAALVAARVWSETPAAAGVTLAVFALGGVIGFPVNLCIAATIVVFGPPAGAALALAGSVLSAGIVYEIGRRLPRDALDRRLGARGMRLRARIVANGLVAVAVVRALPGAPYSVVSLLAGAAHLRRAAYLVGTALGMLPGVVLYAVFADRALALLRAPGPLAWLSLGATLAVLVAFGWLLRRQQVRLATAPGEAASTDEREP